uniref:Lipase-like protein 1 n=1 Tax=Orseolia oryzae TaxID=33408 RepID=B6E246_9DIPT|nr:lipase-like protein 1 [Orseolia oryzae]
MIIYYILLFALFLHVSNSYRNKIPCFRPPHAEQSDKEESDKGNFTLSYQGDPITIACVTNSQQYNFYLIKVTENIPSFLVKELSSNGRGLSLLYHGIGNLITMPNGLLFQFAKEWYQASGKNICIISYAYSTDRTTTGFQIIKHLNKMVKTNRLDFVAWQIRDLVSRVRFQCIRSRKKSCLNSLSQVDISGFSFGAHLASRTCQFLKDELGEKVQMLLALDPSKTPPLVKKPKNTITRGDANYVHVLHTSDLGISKSIGHVDVYVKYKAKTLTEWINDKHALAMYLHVAIASKRLYLIADKDGKGKGIVIQGNGQNVPNPTPNQCVVGIYSVPPPSMDLTKGKEFVVHITDRDILRNSLQKYANPDLFFEYYESPRQSLDQDIILTNRGKSSQWEEASSSNLYGRGNI